MFSKLALALAGHIALATFIVSLSTNYTHKQAEAEALKISSTYDGLFHATVMKPVLAKLLRDNNTNETIKYNKYKYLDIALPLFSVYGVKPLKVYDEEGILLHSPQTAFSDKQLPEERLLKDIQTILEPPKSLHSEIISSTNYLSNLLSQDLPEKAFIMHWYTPHDIGERSDGTPADRLGYKEFTRDVTPEFQSMFDLQRKILLAIGILFMANALIIWRSTRSQLA